MPKPDFGAPDNCDDGMENWETWAKAFHRLLSGIIRGQSSLANLKPIILSWEWHGAQHHYEDEKPEQWCVIDIDGSPSIVVNMLRPGASQALDNYSGCLLLQIIGDRQQHRRWIASPPDCHTLSPVDRLERSMFLAIGAVIGYVQLSGLNNNTMFPLCRGDITPSHN